MTQKKVNSSTSRRDFLKQSSAAVIASSLLPTALSARSHVRVDDTLRVALIGCGGRGTGAAHQALSTEGPVQLVAMADAFQDNLESSYQNLAKNLPAQFKDRLAVTEDRKFVGFDAYQKAMDADVDVVILTTPPGFRPIHFEHAVAQGKHVFMEKPVAVDGPGIRSVLRTAQAAREKNLKVGVGLQRHHETQYKETLSRLQGGAIGDIILLRVYWNSSGVWVRPREEGMTEMQYQMRNWYYFNWLCGDHIVEQHIHNLDVGNWVKGAHPVRAQGQGGRQVRTGKEFGEIFDHHMVEYTYADGTTMLSQCRHIKDCWSSVSEHAHGTLGTADISGGRIQEKAAEGWRYRSDGDKSPYQIEHDDLFQAIRNNEDYNEAETGAEATMTAILGRMATYSGKEVRWEEALNSELSLAPAVYAWDAAPPVLPDENGFYPVAVPGSSKVL